MLFQQKNNQYNGKKVLIALSGGVDSSVAAALLAKQGYDCTGAFFITWTQETPGLTMCPWEQDAADARLVCDTLGIPFYTFNFEQEYSKAVVEYLFAEYQAGRTPNPDILCNKEIKFGLFLSKARELGFDYVATGHYAQIKNTKERYELHRGKDANKDQSYFLYRLTQDQLSSALFPLGKLRKDKVRTIAKKLNLPNWDKKDSQGICFLGEVKLKDFLTTRIKKNPGDIIDTDGNIVGQHDGIAFYTIGQRQGLNIGGAGEPYYLIGKNTEKNQLIVGRQSDPALYKKTITINDIHWIHEQPKIPLHCSAKIRYRQSDQRCTVTASSNNELTIEFTEKQRAIAEGQSVVLYNKAQVLGGGIITI